MAHGMVDGAWMDSTVAGFYEAAAGTREWGAALEPVRQALDAFIVTLFAVDLTAGSILFCYEVSDAPGEFALEYFRHYHALDPRTPALLALEVGEWANCHEHFDDSYVAASPFYQEFMIPHGARYSSGCKLFHDESSAVLWGATRPVGAPPLDGRDIALCKRLAIHLEKAVALFRQHRSAQREEGLGQALLQRLTLPVMLLDDQRRVLHANPIANSLLAGGDGLYLRGDILRCQYDEDDTALLLALRQLRLAGQASQIATAPAKDRVFLRINRRQTAAPFGLHLYALRPEGTLAAFGAQSLALAMLHDPVSRPQLDPLILTETFDLTPAESRVAIALAHGDQAEAIADRHCVSIATIRSQMKAVFAKTGCARQAELVACLTTLPMAIAPPRQTDFRQ